MSLADRVFDGRAAQNEFADRLAEFSGEDADYSPWEDEKFDPYDRSFELLGVDDGFRLSTEALAFALAESGFRKCWLNHLDGSETHYRDDTDVVTRKLTKGGPLTLEPAGPAGRS